MAIRNVTDYQGSVTVAIRDVTDCKGHVLWL